MQKIHHSVSVLYALLDQSAPVWAHLKVGQLSLFAVGFGLPRNESIGIESGTHAQF